MDLAVRTFVDILVALWRFSHQSPVRPCLSLPLPISGLFLTPEDAGIPLTVGMIARSQPGSNSAVRYHGTVDGDSQTACYGHSMEDGTIQTLGIWRVVVDPSLCWR